MIWGGVASSEIGYQDNLWCLKPVVAPGLDTRRSCKISNFSSSNRPSECFAGYGVR